MGKLLFEYSEYYYNSWTILGRSFLPDLIMTVKCESRKNKSKLSNDFIFRVSQQYLNKENVVGKKMNGFGSSILSRINLSYRHLISHMLLK